MFYAYLNKVDLFSIFAGAELVQQELSDIAVRELSQKLGVKYYENIREKIDGGVKVPFQKNNYYQRLKKELGIHGAWKLTGNLREALAAYIVEEDRSSCHVFSGILKGVMSKGFSIKSEDGKSVFARQPREIAMYGSVLEYGSKKLNIQPIPLFRPEFENIQKYAVTTSLDYLKKAVKHWIPRSIHGVASLNV